MNTLTKFAKMHRNVFDNTFDSFDNAEIEDFFDEFTTYDEETDTFYFKLTDLEADSLAKEYLANNAKIDSLSFKNYIRSFDFFVTQKTTSEFLNTLSDRHGWNIAYVQIPGGFGKFKEYTENGPVVKTQSQPKVKDLSSFNVADDATKALIVADLFMEEGLITAKSLKLRLRTLKYRGVQTECVEFLTKFSLFIPLFKTSLTHMNNGMNDYFTYFFRDDYDINDLQKEILKNYKDDEPEEEEELGEVKIPDDVKFDAVEPVMVPNKATYPPLNDSEDKGSSLSKLFQVLDGRDIINQVKEALKTTSSIPSIKVDVPVLEPISECPICHMEWNENETCETCGYKK